MKFAICSEILRRFPFQEQCEKAKGLGYHGLEIAPFTLSPDQNALSLIGANAERICTVIHDNGLLPVGFHALLHNTEKLNDGKGYHLIHPDPAIRSATLSYVKHLADLCHGIGGKTLSWTCPPHQDPATDRAEELKRAASLLHDLCEFCEDMDLTITMGVEGENKEQFTASLAENFYLIKEVAHENLRLHINSTLGPSPIENLSDLIRKSTSHLAHFHAQAIDPLNPSADEIKSSCAINILRKLGYTGWISLKSTPPAPRGNTPTA